MTTGLRKKQAGAGTASERELINSVDVFERNGGKGFWFKSPPLFKEIFNPNQDHWYYRVLAITKAASSETSLGIASDSNASAQSCAMLEAGVVLVVSNQFREVAARGTAYSKDSNRTLFGGLFAREPSILVVSPDVDLATLIHEYQHWKDIQTPGFIEAINREIEKLILSKDDKGILSRFIIEQRAYAIVEVAQRGGLVKSTLEDHMEDAFNFVWSTAFINAEGVYERLQRSSEDDCARALRLFEQFGTPDKSSELNFERVKSTQWPYERWPSCR